MFEPGRTQDGNWLCLWRICSHQPIQLQSCLFGVEGILACRLKPPASSFPGGHTAGVTPVPIPNTEVKPRRADDTARVTVWERRSPPGLKYKSRSEQSGRLFCFEIVEPID